MLKKRSLAAPYLIWMVVFTIFPLAIVIYFAFTNKEGQFTLENIMALGQYLSLIHICALRKEIISHFPQSGVNRYIEVFFGAGWVFFGRETAPGQLEVINDKDGEIVK